MAVRTPTSRSPSVWPLPLSLATTDGISVDVFSCPYLDVSVQGVPRARLFDSPCADRVLLCRVSPFGNLRVKAYVQLTAAYRSLSRPSSAPDAKAFPLRSFSLDLVLAFTNYASSKRIFRNCNCDYPRFLLRNHFFHNLSKAPSIGWLLSVASLLAIFFCYSVFKVRIRIFSRKPKGLLSQGKKSFRSSNWWAQVDSNHRPLDYQSNALAS